MRLKANRARTESKIKKLLNDPNAVIQGSPGGYYLNSFTLGQMEDRGSGFKSLGELLEFVQGLAKPSPEAIPASN